MGKWYLCNDQANVAVIDVNSKYVYPKTINKEKFSVYTVVSPYLWHVRLGHVNYGTMKRITNLGLIPRFELDARYKCETCVETKFAKKPFKSIERTSEPLQLIHSDLCDLKFVESRGGKKYFITFVDDCTRFCYVYLLTSKDETMSIFVKYKNEVETT